MALEKYIVFPPGVDFATMLGERGVGRLVEEMVEEELQTLEEEDDGEGDEQMEEAVDGAERKEREQLIPSNGTENSARDAKEVEDVVSLAVERDGDVEMDLVDANDEGGREVFSFRELHGPRLFGLGRSASREGILGQTRIRESAVATAIARGLTGRPTGLVAKW